MVYTKIEAKHTYNNDDHEMQLTFAPLENYALSTETSVLDTIFMYPIKFEVKYPSQGDEMNERVGRKINIKNIKIMFKTEIKPYYGVLGQNDQYNPLYYFTKGLYGIIKHNQTINTQGSATAQNIQGSTYGLPKVNGSAQTTGNFATTAGATALGVYYNVPEAQLSTIQGTTSAQQITSTTNYVQYDHLILPPRKLKLKLRVMIVKAAKDYFDSDGVFDEHKALEWFVLNRVYVGSDPQVDNKINFVNISNTDMILRESSDYTGQYSIKFDKIITHTVGTDEMVTFDIPINQELTFGSEGDEPTNKDIYHILVFPPFTNKGLSGPYGYEKLPELRFAKISDPTQISQIDSYYNGDCYIEQTAQLPYCWIDLHSNVKLQYLDF